MTAAAAQFVLILFLLAFAALATAISARSRTRRMRRAARRVEVRDEAWLALIYGATQRA